MMIIWECRKLVQKEYKTKYEWVGKMIHWKFCKRLKFDYASKWHMHKPKFDLENEIHKILWDFEIQMDYLILARRPKFVLIVI